MFTCKICKKKFTELTGLYNHIEYKHKEMIPKNMSVQQYYYYMKTGKSNGNCVMCKQPTSWNGNTNKYNRFCDDPKCKEEYAKEFKKRMIGKYGKVHLLNDPEKQREMLAKRKISGKYRWDNGKETTYTGSYELDFLKTLDGFFDWDPSDIMMPSPHNYVYKYQGEDKIYIPDVFIPSLDLEIEIKDGGDNPNRHHKIQDVDKVKEKNKDEVMMSQKAFHYIKITNKNYTNFFNFLAEAKASFEKHGDSKKMPRIFKIEDIRTKPEVVNEGLTDIVGQLNNITMSDMDGIISYNINRKSKNQPELKKYMLSLIKPCKDLNDIEVIRKHAKKVADEVNKLGKKKEYKQECQEFMDWLDDEFNKELNKQMNKLNKSVKESMEVIEENVITESSISYSRLNEYLQDDTNQRMAEYLDTYFNYYKKMCKEKPDARPHINNDVKKAKQFVLDLDKKGKIDLDMTTYTINRLDKILGESYETSSECSNSIKIDLVYDPKKCPRQAFMLKDSDSKLYINEEFYIQRLDDYKKPGSCKTGFDITMDTEGKKVLEFVVTLPEPVDISKKLNELNSQEIKINSLFNPRDNNKLFLQEVCRMLGVEGTITRVSDFLY